MTTAALPGAGRFLGLLALVALALAAISYTRPSTARQPVPDPRVDAPLAQGSASQTAVFAGGCFWGVEAVFEHVRGVRSVKSGYAGGSAASANYQAVSAGRTDHAEVVRISFDPSVISYGQLLKVFFSVAHDPTQLDRQGPDRGRQYRSAIYYVNPEQQRIAQGYIRQMGEARVFGNKPIVTRIEPLKMFFTAEAYHQDFARLNPTHPYIVHWDAPKVRHLQRDFPGLYREWGQAEPGSRAAAPRG